MNKSSNSRIGKSHQASIVIKSQSSPKSKVKNRKPKSQSSYNQYNLAMT